MVRCAPIGEDECVGFSWQSSLESSLNQKSCFSLLNLSNSSAAREWTASQTNQEGRDLLGNSAAVMLFFDQADKEGEPYQANSKII
jgi:hypothetical protein